MRCNAILTCATCTTRWPMARQHSKKGCGEKFDEPIIPFEALVEFIPFTAKDKSVEIYTCFRQ